MNKFTITPHEDEVMRYPCPEHGFASIEVHPLMGSVCRTCGWSTQQGHMAARWTDQPVPSSDTEKETEQYRTLWQLALKQLERATARAEKAERDAVEASQRELSYRERLLNIAEMVGVSRFSSRPVECYVRDVLNERDALRSAKEGGQRK